MDNYTDLIENLRISTCYGEEGCEPSDLVKPAADAITALLRENAELRSLLKREVDIADTLFAGLGMPS